MHDYLTAVPLNYKVFAFNKQTTLEFSRECLFPSSTLTFSIWETSIWEAFDEMIIKEWKHDDFQTVLKYLITSKLLH